VVPGARVLDGWRTRDRSGRRRPERAGWDEVVLRRRLRAAVERINPQLRPDAVDGVVATVLRPESQNPLAENLRIHRLLTEGVPVEQRDAAGEMRYPLAWLLDYERPERNDWLVANQFTVVETGTKGRRPDVVVFVNGLPLGLFELKNAGDEHATLRGAWNQLQTYRADIPSMFPPNVVCVAADGLQAVMGAFSAGFEHFTPWKTIDGRVVVTDRPQLEVLVRGVFEPARFLDLVRNFVLFSDEPAGLVKRVAKYHQFWAVKAAVASTIEAAGPDGDRRGGVVWHTQGSGKSIEMLLYAAKVARSPEMGNPTLVFITDRNDLDDQLYTEVFAPARILPEQPVQATSRAELRRLLDRASEASCSRQSRSSCPTRRARSIPRSHLVATSSSSPTRPTAASTTSSTASPATSETPSPTRPTSGSPARRSRRVIVRPSRCSATTSTSTTSPEPSRTAPPSGSTTSRAWPRSAFPRRPGARSTPRWRR
jgi:type I restriction enzyme R subunit